MRKEWYQRCVTGGCGLFAKASKSQKRRAFNKPKRCPKCGHRSIHRQLRDS